MRTNKTDESLVPTAGRAAAFKIAGSKYAPASENSPQSSAGSSRLVNLQNSIDNSPYMAAQRKIMSGIPSRGNPENDTPVQLSGGQTNARQKRRLIYDDDINTFDNLSASVNSLTPTEQTIEDLQTSAIQFGDPDLAAQISDFGLQLRQPSQIEETLLDRVEEVEDPPSNATATTQSPRP